MELYLCRLHFMSNVFSDNRINGTEAILRAISKEEKHFWSKTGSVFKVKIHRKLMKIDSVYVCDILTFNEEFYTYRSKEHRLLLNKWVSVWP